MYHRNRGTLCEKDLASDRYILEGDNGEDEGRTLAASKLIRLYGPKGGPQSRNDEAIKIRPPYAKVQSSSMSLFSDMQPNIQSGERELVMMRSQS